MIYNSIVELIGDTPLVRLNKIEEAIHTNCKIYGKLEKQNPAGSIKDRAALSMINKFIKENKIGKNTTIIEPTSGNTGIGLACLGNYFNNKVLIVMPQSASLQRREILKDYNAELVLVDGGMKECVLKAKELNFQIKDSIICGQFDNEANVDAHYKTTGPEIYKDLREVEYIFAGIGTGGTISGIGKFFKEIKNNTFIIGIEPENSPLINKGYSGKHHIEGIGANFIPKNFKSEYVDKVIDVNDEDAIYWAKIITKLEGYLVGVSSGAALSGAIKYIKENNLEYKNIVIIFPDTGERYSWN